MTATTVPPAPAQADGPARAARRSSSTDPTARQIWGSARGPALLAAVVLLAGLVMAIAGSGTKSGLLDPRAVDPSGSRAVAEVLRDQGVQVELVTRSSQLASTARPGDTVLVAFPERLLDEQVAAVRESGADLVLVGAVAPEQFVPGVALAEAADTEERRPVCSLPAAERAGTADAGGLAYVMGTGGGPQQGLVTGCYSSGGRASLLQVEDAGRAVTFLGNYEPLTNDRFDDLGNAALVLGLLGQNERLLWYLPSLADVPPGESQTLLGMVPDAVWWGLAQAVIAVLLLMLWRARRLGPVVAEPLPVIVRAAETVEGRARLYRRGGARDKAAAALRGGAVARWEPLLGLPRRAELPAVVDAVAARTRRTGPDVAALLYGAAPADDAALVRLANDLDALDREIRRP